MSEAQTIQWFPGHMTRTKRQIEKSLKMVDIVAEIIDARVPVSSRNPILKKLIGNKHHSTVLYACKTIEELKEVDKTFRAEMEEIQADLRKG